MDPGTYNQTLNFPSGSWFKKRENTLVQVDGREFRLAKVIHESYLDGGNLWKVLFEGFPTDDPCQTVILKYRYEYYLLPVASYLMHVRILILRLHPFLFETDKKHIAGSRKFLDEVAAMKACQGSGHTPIYISHEVQRQRQQDDPYPGEGYVWVLVMSKLPGLRLFFRFIPPEPLVVTRQEMRDIRQQCIDTQEYANAQGFSTTLGIEHVIYDPESKHVFFFGMHHVEPGRDETPDYSPYLFLNSLENPPDMYVKVVD
ncbi:hypothetical protein ASPZODRAFT_129056 [Penicilliopsis zonata CBS 506.65]|uniref:Uncharacterized protein n=1 Tax=Penicilliopsis zonata CBS 506.65 TaxID=1073090 RepID=A0A1L9STG7_9EURO|nr:hypothetical protein ASPZODRAFT_129056 [Penicilliopsis zonata CBS 506.65]OJJ50426.1 hypothetical protein ASPZODRAFT_129056 [Penicilliopsis zonata CBS 506.65]